MYAAFCPARVVPSFVAWSVGRAVIHPANQSRRVKKKINDASKKMGKQQNTETKVREITLKRNTN